jgi:dihydroorotate dehydrogenase
VKRFLISPPFGSRFGHEGCTRVMGSYTLHRRNGLIWNTLKSLRKIEGGWVNRIGLRNPGIKSLQGSFVHDRIYSFVGMEDTDWSEMLHLIPDFVTVELNLGCPNVHQYGIEEKVLRNYTHHFKTIVKLPATELVDDVAAMAVAAGANYLHCSNTLPTPRGGESGRRLKKWNLPVVYRLHARYPEIPIIAGGGIYGVEDVKDYEEAGASHFSLSTVWFTPWRAREIIRVA